MRLISTSGSGLPALQARPPQRPEKTALAAFCRRAALSKPIASSGEALQSP
jgi:hypothetical protein